MGEFTILEHTADGALEARADDFIDLLKTTARGMFSLMVNPDSVKAVEVREFTSEGEDELELLLNFLKDLLHITNTEFFYFKDFDIEKVFDEPIRVKCKGVGEKIDPERHIIYGEVKMVTYHDIRFESEGSNYKVRLLFDM